jgi:hypothetical protein
MALISNPDPMPVEVINALALEGLVLDELPGAMTELIDSCVRVTLPNLSATDG